MSEPVDTSLLRRLPRLYRRDGGRVLDGFVAIAQSLVDRLESAIGEATTDKILADLESRGIAVGSARSSLATARDLRREISGSLPQPLIWHGRYLDRAVSADLIVREPVFGRSAILAWVRSDLSSPEAREALALGEAPKGGREIDVALAERLDLDTASLAAGVELQAVLLENRPTCRVPIPGMRLVGSIFWEHGGFWEQRGATEGRAGSTADSFASAELSNDRAIDRT